VGFLFKSGPSCGVEWKRRGRAKWRTKPYAKSARKIERAALFVVLIGTRSGQLAVTNFTG
jgi:hypothetical protein